MRNKMSYMLAFTLAEVLITLTIIGVVASMTIPGLMHNYQKKVILSQLKKTYAELSQAIQMSALENGNTEDWSLENNLATVQGHKEYGDKYIAPYLKIAQKAGGVSGWWTCTPNKQFPGLYCVSTVSKKSNYSAWVPYIYYLQSGAAVTVGGWNQRVLTVDVNGMKKPNRAGYDVFTFSISDNKLVSPSWSASDNWSCDEKSTHSYNGWACASRIINNSWEFPDDYPIKF